MTLPENHVCIFAIKVYEGLKSGVLQALLASLITAVQLSGLPKQPEA